MYMQLDFSEIKDSGQFEDLVAAYFEDLRNSNKEFPQVRDVETSTPGKGTDGGKDILVTFTINDTVATYYKKWLVQCKFHDDTLSPSDLKDDNIPTLIHSYGANGYLLVCKNDVSQKLVNLFERLEKECLFRYKYQIWKGNKLRQKIVSNTSLLKTYFPKYYSSISQNSPK